MLVWSNPSSGVSEKVTLPPLVPPFRFSVVEGSSRKEALYRSAYPTERNFRFLKRLKLKTIISLVPRDMQDLDLIRSFCRSENINHIHYPASSTQKPLDASVDDPNAPAPTHALCAQILTLCIDQDKLPLLVHCTNGAHITGLIVALLRKLQHYNSESYLEEFARFSKNHKLGNDEKVFLAKYFSAVTLPGSLPQWLWGGERPTKHPTMPLYAAAVAVGLSPEDAEADMDFSPPAQPVPQSTRDGETHVHMTRTQVAEVTTSAELLSALTVTQDESATEKDAGLRGMSLEDPSSVMRRRTTG